MGACASSSLSPEEEKQRKAEIARSKELEKQLKEANNAEATIHKLLLLGAGESGKSTLFKQMISIHGKGFPESDRKTFTSIIHNNVMTSIKTLAVQSDKLATQGFETQVHPDIAQIKEYFQNQATTEEVLTPEHALRIQHFWADKGIRMTYKLRSRYQLTDSTAYFLDAITRICAPGFIPTEDDVLRTRVRTTGIIENEFIIDGNEFKMFDVGGQRNERKKWIHCFEDVTAVLFVAALSAYDLVLFEDEEVNRMEEALNLFSEICNSQWFKKTSMILMLNKRDLFKDKIQTVPITACPVFENEYPSEQSPNDYEECVDFIRKSFEGLNKSKTKQIYTHITCATDKANIKHVFNAVKDTVIRRSLEEGGLLN